MRTFTAFVRQPTPAFTRAISSHAKKDSIDFPKALSQHQAYVEALRNAGGRIVQAPNIEDCPDQPFVEDVAVVCKGVALACPMREPTRQPEAPSLLNQLEDLLAVKFPPETVWLDGGDALATDRHIFVGQSKRSNAEAIPALQALTNKTVVGVDVLRGLHLKSAASYLADNTLLVDPLGVDTEQFKDYKMLEVCEEESYAANGIALGDAYLMPSGFPETHALLRESGLFQRIVELEMSEFEKADGGLTCLSIIVPD
ncbi:MAG: hypothetical protein G3M78_07385 [Candidatus Nitrohelix vancouverensis]|uniref:Dimethylargininase n=1 Tax=Candidatus Nitrohelix vancouverensis TaxID=2705534 RepID=A0A7T0G3G3_9BACT|nr:MAG: hypothetical protein G3M78_07385 [Candidatus Nitrohelix vancouverensis]